MVCGKSESLDSSCDTIELLGPDCVFLVGVDEEPVEVNRAILAHSNPMLAKILYGTEDLSVNLDDPIKWPLFDPEVVRLVFSALTKSRADNLPPTVIPIQLGPKFYMLLDFLNETKAHVDVLEAKFENQFVTARSGREPSLTLSNSPLPSWSNPDCEYWMVYPCSETSENYDWMIGDDEDDGYVEGEDDDE